MTEFDTDQVFARFHPLTGEELDYDEVPLGFYGEDLEAYEIPVVRQIVAPSYTRVETVVNEPVVEWHERDVIVHHQVPVPVWVDHGLLDGVAHRSG